MVSNQDVTVDFTVTGGTATGGGVDYTLAAGTATINAGSTTTNISIAIVDDSLSEPNETIIVKLSSPVNASLGTNTQHTYTIVDNDPAKLIFDQQPTSTVASAIITPAVTVKILDVNDNLVTTATDAVTIAINDNPGGGTLSGTLSQAAVGGVATFNDLSIDKAGIGYTLKATSSPSYIPATSSAFDIYPLPDLIISSGIPTVTPQNVAPGGTVQLSAWIIKNQGAGDCNSPTGSIRNGFYLSTDSTITSSDTLLDYKFNTNDVLETGEQFNWGGPTLTIPAGTALGNYYIGILVDDTNLAQESDETNNFVSTPLAVVDTTPPQVSITDPSASKTVISTSYTIKGTASDAVSGLAKVEVSIDGGTSWHDATGTSSWSFVAILALGANVVKAKATDNEGNISAPTAGVTLTCEATVTDPDETDIPNGKDFMSIKPYKVGSNLKSVIKFYANWDSSQFKYYFSIDTIGTADFVVRCYADRFIIKKGAFLNAGLYDIEVYRGTPTVSGDTYTLEIPWSELEGEFQGYDSLEKVDLWLAFVGGDRLPDAGLGSITFRW